jgi:hypothetical protein
MGKKRGIHWLNPTGSRAAAEEKQVPSVVCEPVTTTPIPVFSIFDIPSHRPNRDHTPQPNENLHLRSFDGTITNSVHFDSLRLLIVTVQQFFLILCRCCPPPPASCSGQEHTDPSSPQLWASAVRSGQPKWLLTQRAAKSLLVAHTPPSPLPATSIKLSSPA